MRRMIMMMGALSLAIPASMALPASQAQARHHHYYSGRSYRGARRCTHSGGTTGLVAGGVGGALVGNSILGHGALGTVAGAAGGALAGRAIDRSITAHRRCR